MECGHRCPAAVEAEHELVDVVGQMLRADTVVCAFQPGLEIGESPVDPGEESRRVLRVALSGRAVVVRLAQRGVPLPSIRQYRTPRLYRCLDERDERARREILDDSGSRTRSPAIS